MVSMDASPLSLLLHPHAKPPLDPATGKSLIEAPGRIERLIEDLHTANERIVIPTPALAEFLVLAGGDAQQYLSELANQPIFRIQPFDLLAAVELAAMENQARGKGSKRIPVARTVPWQKVKYDRQIVAISKVHRVHTIYSDDADVKAIAEDLEIKVISCCELPLPSREPELFDNIPVVPEQSGRRFRDE